MELDNPKDYYFYILNRWGKRVFETRDPMVRWDGTVDGQEATQGVYIYYIQYSTPGGKIREERGNFTLIR